MLKRLGAALGALVILATAAVAIATQVGPELAPYEAHLMTTRVPDSVTRARGLTVTFLGVATLLFDDGETAILTDGFFTRPGLVSLLTRIRPDSAIIRKELDRAGITRLAAVIPVHSHYDHAMDAPFVAKWTGAELLGSTSTANIGRGAGLPDDRIRVPALGETISYGRFTVTLLRSAHVPSPAPMAGEITAPLTPPAKTADYRVGEAYSIVIRHDGRTMLVQGSSGFIPGALKDVKADVVYLSVGILGKQSPEYRDSLWNEVVVATGAKRVIVIHWDDFLRPLSKPLRPLPRLMDDFDTTMRFLLSHTGAGAPNIGIAVEFVRTDPFAGLPATTLSGEETGTSKPGTD
jgi:L-ascorbate metabolism protein UlaG (beta-lactamase superfamily)